MNKMLLFLFLLLCGCGALRPDASDAFLSNKTKLSHALHATVGLVRAENEPEDARINTRGQHHSLYCAGVFIEENTILTAAHCLENQSYVQTPFGAIPIGEPTIAQIVKVSTRQYAYQRDGAITDYRLFGLIKIDEDTDLALLQRLAGERPIGRHSVSPILKNDFVEAGDKVFSVGHPTGLTWVIGNGIISEPVIEENFILANINTFFGSSGGPLFDSNGNLIGICSFIRGHRGFPVFYLSFWVSVDTIKEFVQ